MDSKSKKMGTPTYKLYYFNLQARGEAARLVFAQARVEYKDIRFTQEEWKDKYKRQSPFGTCPWIEVDGRQIGGSVNIARFLGEQFGLSGGNDIEKAQLAAIADTFNDCRGEAVVGIFMKEEIKKAKIVKDFQEKSCKWLDVLEGKISDEGWLQSKKMTWVDIYVYSGLCFLAPTYPNLLTNYPKLTTLKKNVEKQPNIAQWLKERPDTPVHIEPFLV